MIRSAEFDRIQHQFGDVPGADGVALRREHYSPFFLRLGRDVVIAEGCRFVHPDRIVLEDDVRINIGALIYGSGGVWIGRHARIGPRCFIHSANHEIDENSLAFHERGYQYKPVRVGDNVLISANVSIMPGTEIGDGCFIAAGAVVPGKKIPPNTHLYGVPAQEKGSSGSAEREFASPAPDIALIVPPAGVDRKAASSSELGSGQWADIARHVLGPLGLPQVAVLDAGSELPRSVHSVVLFGPEAWKPDIRALQPIDVWSLAAGNAVSGTQLNRASSADGSTDLPEVQTLTVVQDGRGRDDFAGKLQQVFFWLGERLNKGPNPLSPSEFSEWGLLRRLSGEAPGLESYWKRAAADLDRRRPPGIQSGLQTIWSSLTRKSALATPDVLVRQVMAAIEQRSPQRIQQLAELAREVLEHSTTGRRLVAVGICATLLNDVETASIVRHRLEQWEWSHEGVAFPYSSPGGPGFCFSPLVAAWLLLQAREKTPNLRLPENLGVSSNQSRPLSWGALTNGSLFDPQTKEISRSLVDCWLSLHSAPCPEGAQYKLDRSNYAPTIAALETVWLDAFRSIQHNKGRPLVRLRPWPAPYTAAFSMRYDVDRPVSSKRIAELVELQAKYANAPCATWYYFPTDPSRTRHANPLQWSWQEIGLHLQSADEAERGVGVTHHSAATSDYWRGDAMNARLDERGAEHGEFLAAQTPTPRPAWIRGPDGNGRRGTMWTTSIYFPLEGATDNKTLEYFNRLAREFWAMLAQGAHVIVGSHPDIDQWPLAEILQHNDFRQVWCATVGDVVARCRQVLEPGAIWTVAGENGEIKLCSHFPIADLVVETWPSNAQALYVEVVQLTGTPRALRRDSSSV